MKQEIFIFIGPPGAGKGTLSDLCVERWGWRQISTGNLCRRHIIEQTNIGKEIDFAIKSGKLVSDSLIANIVGDAISELRNGSPIILDGYPRTVAQAKQLHNMIKDDVSLNVYIIHLKALPQTVISRLTNRYVCQNKECQRVYSFAFADLAPKSVMVCDRCNSKLGKRSDDQAESIMERLRIYYEHEEPLLAEYRKKRFPIIQIVVERQVEDIFNEFITQLRHVIHDNDKK